MKTYNTEMYWGHLHLADEFFFQGWKWFIISTIFFFTSCTKINLLLKKFNSADWQNQKKFHYSCDTLYPNFLDYLYPSSCRVWSRIQNFPLNIFSSFSLHLYFLLHSIYRAHYKSILSPVTRSTETLLRLYDYAQLSQRIIKFKLFNLFSFQAWIELLLSNLPTKKSKK